VPHCSRKEEANQVCANGCVRLRLKTKFPDSAGFLGTQLQNLGHPVMIPLVGSHGFTPCDDFVVIITLLGLSLGINLFFSKLSGSWNFF
jgi:hypothetical protein